LTRSTEEPADSRESRRDFGDSSTHISVHQKIDHGLEDVEAGRTLSEEEFDQRMAKWLEP
jgi:predicted transcriptional regulator